MSKINFFVVNMLTQAENPRKSTERKLKTRSDFSEVQKTRLRFKIPLIFYISVRRTPIGCWNEEQLSCQSNSVYKSTNKIPLNKLKKRQVKSKKRRVKSIHLVHWKLQKLFERNQRLK